MIWTKPNKIMRMLLLLYVLSMVSSCGLVRHEPRYTNVKPQLEPLPANVLQAMQPDSTDLLQRASAWSKNSSELLNSANPKTEPSDSKSAMSGNSLEAPIKHH